MMDVNGDNALTLEEMMESYTVFCGNEEKGEYIGPIFSFFLFFLVLQLIICRCVFEVVFF